ncbi:MAG: hypothetical protein ACYCOU_15095 [Sulfobacillus sp.]
MGTEDAPESLVAEGEFRNTGIEVSFLFQSLWIVVQKIIHVLLEGSNKSLDGRNRLPHEFVGVSPDFVQNGLEDLIDPVLDSSREIRESGSIESISPPRFVNSALKLAGPSAHQKKSSFKSLSVRENIFRNSLKDLPREQILPDERHFSTPIIDRNLI